MHKLLVVLLSFVLVSCGTDVAHRHHTIGDVEEKVIYYPPPHQIKEAGSFIPKITRAKERKIALLLPLSGRYAELGQSLFNAAQLALFDFGMSNITLMPFDTQGTAFGAVKATKEMLTYNVDLVLGPVFSKSTLAISDLVKERNIPVISFSNDRTLTNHGVYIMGWLPDQQVERIVRYALKEGINEFAAILPNTHFGAESAKELRETIKLDEESVVLKSEFYRIESSGKAAKLHQHVFAAYNAALNQRSSLDYDEELEAYNEEPIDYPRGLLIPEGKERLQDILRLLSRYGYDKEKVQLLGTSQWFDDALLREPLVDGAWFALAPRKKKQMFAEKYRAVFHTEPAGIANIAYDAIALAATLARISDNDPYHVEKLTNPRGFVGTEGVFRFLENGLIERGLAVYQIRDGAFILKESAPKSFYKVLSFPKPASENAEKTVKKVSVEEVAVESEGGAATSVEQAAEEDAAFKNREKVE